MKRLLYFVLTLACLFTFSALAEDGADNVAAEDEVIVAGQVDEAIPSVEQTLDDTTLENETLSAEEPAAEEPAVDESSTEEPVEEEPAVDEPAVDEPSTEEPVDEEPAAEEPAAEEPAVEEPAVEEPMTEKPSADEPATEEPVVEKLVEEEPAAKEPVKDEGAENDAEEVIASDATDEDSTEVDELSEMLPALPTTFDLTYIGVPQALVSDPGEGAFLYSLNGENLSAEIPTGTDAGEYTVYYKPAKDADSESVALTVIIKKAEVILIPPVANAF